MLLYIMGRSVFSIFYFSGVLTQEICHIFVDQHSHDNYIFDKREVEQQKLKSMYKFLIRLARCVDIFLFDDNCSRADFFENS